LAAAAVVVAALASACVYDPGPSPTSGPAPAPTGISPEEAVIREVFGPLGAAEKAVSVAICESGMNPGADSGTYKGLFQLGPHLEGTVAFYGGNWFDPLTNAQVARDLYLQSGWAPWPHCGG
jgi:hypothetical protein